MDVSRRKVIVAVIFVATYPSWKLSLKTAARKADNWCTFHRILINNQSSRSSVGRVHRTWHSTKILYPQIAGDNLVGVDTANICTRDRNKGWRAGGDGARGSARGKTM